MTKYIAKNPNDQPLHDMMDEIEIAYRKCLDKGINPQKIYWCMLHMVKIFFDNHPWHVEKNNYPPKTEIN